MNNVNELMKAVVIREYVQYINVSPQISKPYKLVTMEWMGKAEGLLKLTCPVDMNLCKMPCT